MLDYNFIASTVASLSDLPCFIAKDDSIDIVRLGFLSSASLTKFYKFLFQKRTDLSDAKPTKKPTFIRIVNRFGLSVLCVTMNVKPLTSILFGPFFLENKDVKNLTNELCSIEDLYFTPETANYFINIIPIKDSSFVQAWGQVLTRYLELPDSPYVKINTIVLNDQEMEEASTISENRINEATISSHYVYERELQNLMRNGDREKLKVLLLPRDTSTAALAQKHSVFEERVLGKNSIRAERNLIITLNVMFRQAAIDSGLPPLYVHSISEDIVRKIDNANDRESLMRIVEQMIDNYCNSINNIAYQNHSVNVVKVQKYIISNKSEKITLETLCGLTGLDESYLCRLFKRECHMTINEYIQTQRTNEAKWILASSDTPIIEIANLLGYSSQSYFCSVFKRIVGVTPSQYRMNRGNFYKMEDTPSKSIDL